MDDQVVSAAEDVVDDLSERRSYLKAKHIIAELDRDYAPQQLSHVMGELRERGVIEKWNNGTTGATWRILDTNAS